MPSAANPYSAPSTVDLAVASLAAIDDGALKLLRRDSQLIRINGYVGIVMGVPLLLFFPALFVVMTVMHDGVHPSFAGIVEPFLVLSAPGLLMLASAWPFLARPAWGRRVVFVLLGGRRRPFGFVRAPDPLFRRLFGAGRIAHDDIEREYQRRLVVAGKSAP